MRAYTAWMLLALALTVSEPASARAEARVTLVEAQVDVRDPEVARVELWLRVFVSKGRLSSVALEGLDADFRLRELMAPSGTLACATVPPHCRSLALRGGSQTGVPIVSHERPGHLELTWSDPKTAPSEGEHAVRVAYETRQLYQAARTAGTSRMLWTLPRWPERLANVRVTVIGPPGLRAFEAESNLGEQVEAVPPDAPRMLTFTRTELPRLTDYAVQFEVPRRVGEADSGEAFGWLLPTAQLKSWTDELCPLAIGVCFAGLVVGKRRVRRKRLVARRLLIPALDKRSYDRAIFVLATLAPLLISRAPAIALGAAFFAVATALEQRRPRGTESSEEPTSDWLSAKSALDATTPAGLACALTLLAAAVLAPEPLHGTAVICSWLAMPLFFSGTRHRQQNA
jgi:hypothetical protein